ncbi:hypothetical protein N7532_010673 [Penicillium argentinense]|uniref:Protein YAE1 n=1 Tax=Penicillium argentinense TaxID=1131581 RepID=A0A9W9EQ13_9EURO|nr:uncharacterized protein N7532_010673 [Penicillium argentinense]KAJ5085902.1 hypothetical protein N7532_010673 [Penicillium argentinense]
MASKQNDARSALGENEVDNSLDDIFGSSPPDAIETRAHQPAGTQPSAELNDLPALRRQHVTAGYRDGVSTSKTEHVQEGFDAGFPVGAQLGMRAGTILGILEGITRGLEDRSVSGVVKKPARGTASGSASALAHDTRQEATEDARRELRERIANLYQEATQTLDVQSVFAGFEGGSEPTGPPTEADVAERKAEEMAETQLGRKGDTVVSGWEERVAVPRWEENMEALEEKDASGPQSDKKAETERS